MEVSVPSVAPLLSGVQCSDSVEDAVIPVYEVKVKVKVTLVQALRLCTGRTAHRGSRGIALLYRH
jgi:hypothetical protein